MKLNIEVLDLLYVSSFSPLKQTAT